MVTPLTGTTGAYGNMFDVQSYVDATVTSLEFFTNLGSPPKSGMPDVYVNVRVYAKQAGHSGYENDPPSWSLVSDARVRAFGVPRPLPSTNPYSLPSP